MGVDWKQKGRDRASRMIEYAALFTDTGRTDAIRITAERTGDHEAWLREHFADLLAAARWGYGLRIDEERVIRGHMDMMPPEHEALRLLTEGFRERLKELAESPPSGHVQGDRPGGGRQL